MRILVINYEFPPLGGGAANANYYIFNEFSKYEKNELSVDLITSSQSCFRIENFSSNIRIHFLNIGKGENVHYQSNLDLLRFSYSAYFYGKKLIKKKKYDLVHAFFGIPCGFIATKLGLPFIVSLRGSDVPFYNERFRIADKILFQRLSRKIWKRASSVIANSKGLKELALKTLANTEIEIIPNGIDTEQFSQKKYNSSSTEIKFISTGRLIKRKGYEYLIKALRGIDNVKLTLLGDGNQREELQNLAKSLNVNCVFRGSIPHEKIAAELTQADIFVLPSDNEGMSNSVLEAMACGLPIIVTKVGGTEELISENGIIVEKSSTESLRNAIFQYKNNPEKIEEHGVESRKLAMKYNWENISNQYFELYQKALIK